MNESKDSQIIICLSKGDLLIKSLIEEVKKQNISGAWINGLGAAEWAEIGFYDLPNKKYNWSKINQPLEILSLQGNIAWKDGEPVIHIHGVFSDDKMNTIGGHVKELEVAGSCEIFIILIGDTRIERGYDEDTGLNLLDIGK